MLSRGDDTMFRKTIATGTFAASLLAFAPAFGADAKPPATSNEHLTLANRFRHDAAERYRRALTLYQRANAYASQNKSSQAVRLGQVPQWVVDQRERDLAMATAEERLAAAELNAADYHALRATELQGQ
ncbi:MAG: hypothetical protein ABUS79_16825 [Pseudomonadota bacterium]